MSFLGALKDDKSKPEEITRWVEVIEADPAIDEPAVEFLVAYVNNNKMQNLIKPFANKTNTNENDESRFRQGLMRAAVRDWRGMTPGNLGRISDYIAERPSFVQEITEQLEEGGLSELPFEIEEAKNLGPKLDGTRFTAVMNASTSLAEFATEQEVQEKKDSTSSSDSA